MHRQFLPMMLFCLSAFTAFADVREPALTPATPESCADHVRADLPEFHFQSKHHRVSLRALSDEIVHIDFAPKRAAAGEAFATSPFIDPRAFARFRGPRALETHARGFSTSTVEVTVDENLCVTVVSRTTFRVLNRICPQRSRGEWQRFKMESSDTTDIYGLGEQFLKSQTDHAYGNWMGEVRHPGNEEGNYRPKFHGGGIGNAQFPIMYALGAGAGRNYALYVDHVQRQVWDFRAATWTLGAQGEHVRMFFIAGEDLSSLHKSYMGLVGHPLVPPKSVFGLWMSRYGYRNWSEIDELLTSLRRDGFPVDGFALDIFWFGGVNPGSPTSRMGTLGWDESNFPNPAGTISRLKRERGVSVMPIEEPYVSAGLPEHAAMESRGFMAGTTASREKAFFIDEKKKWWGVGGLIDFTNREARRFWHNWKREALLNAGIVGLWTDLGEPEQSHWEADWNARPFYAGIEGVGQRQSDVQNAYSFFWHQGIYEGMVENGRRERPYMLSRSAGPGSQRFGATMWSGDIATNYGSLRAHLSSQTHVALSGMYYFGSDIAGHYRAKGLALEPDTDLNQLYTKWFAISAAIDVPVRPHTMDLDGSNPTAPNVIGHKESNLANIRLRVQLTPYYYSLAHRAHQFAEPLIAPLVYYYQNAPTDRADKDPRKINDEKLIGRDLLVATPASASDEPIDVYLPPGGWFDVHTGDEYQSSGETLAAYPVYRDGLFRLPLFARAGAVLPLLPVDGETMNSLGQRKDGTRRDELIARAYAGPDGQFTVYEDDGESIGYTEGAVAMTPLTQMTFEHEMVLLIEPTAGGYPGMTGDRRYQAEFVPPTGWALEACRVELNGAAIPAQVVGKRIVALSGHLSVCERKEFRLICTPAH